MSRKAPTPPPPELAEQIKREVAAPGFLSSLTTWADRQCGKLLSIEDRHEPGKADDLVSAAVVAALDGVRRWDPAARTFRRHCEQIINSWLWNECEKLRRRRHITLDTTSVDDSQDETAVDVEMSLRREDVRTRPDGLLAQREVRAKVFAALRSRTREDDGVLRSFIDAYEAGHSREGDVVARLGLSDQAFRATLARFYRLKAQLPAELRRSAMEVMIQDGGPATPTITRHKGRIMEIVADGTTADELAGHAADSLNVSSDGGDSTDGDGQHDAA